MKSSILLITELQGHKQCIINTEKSPVGSNEWLCPPRKQAIREGQKGNIKIKALLLRSPEFLRPEPILVHTWLRVPVEHDKSWNWSISPEIVMDRPWAQACQELWQICQIIFLACPNPWREDSRNEQPGIVQPHDEFFLTSSMWVSVKAD